MRVLHTGDWHMNDRLGRVSRAADIVRALERIAAYLESEAVDVMVVAGDLFCDKSSKEDLRAAIGEIERIFGPFLARRGTIVAISGNHDSETFFHTLQDALKLAPTPAVGTSLDPIVSAPGRLYLFPRPDILRLADPSGCIVQFALMPYPTAQWLRQTDASSAASEVTHGATVPAQMAAEQHLTKQDRFTRYLNEKIVSKRDDRLPIVLVSHILVSGVTSHGYKLDVENDVVVATEGIPPIFAYVAYGHIHAPQAPTAGSEFIRYCGSVERLDAGEAEDIKSVVVVDVGPAGRIGAPRVLPLGCDSPFLRLTLGTAEGANPEIELAKLEKQYADQAVSERERYLVQYTLHYRYGHDRLDELIGRLRTLFPRIYYYHLNQVRLGEDGSIRPGLEEIRLEDVNKNVLDYVEHAVQTSDPDREEILAAVRSLLGSSEEDADAPVPAIEKEETA